MTSPNHPGSLYTLDFESMTCGSLQVPTGWVQQAPTTIVHPNNEPPYRIACQPSPVRLGGNAARFQLNRGDKDVPRAGSVRTEMAAAEPNEPDKQERWYGFSIYLEQWVADRSPEVLTQWHQTDVDDPRFKGSPPLAVLTSGKFWCISIRTGWDSTKSNETHNIPVREWAPNIWTDWIMHVVWRDSDASDAVTEAWVNGIYLDAFNESRRGKQNKFADGAGGYTKFGIYKWDWANRDTDTAQRVIFYDELRIADHTGSREAVSPHGMVKTDPRE
jgi:hypothetical protein